MKYNQKFEKVLPRVNLTESFIITESAYSSVAKDWIDFVDTIVEKAFDGSGKFKTFRGIIKEKTSLFAMCDRGKDILGIGSKFSVVDIDISGTQVEYKAKMGYKELIEIYFSSDKLKIGAISMRVIIDRFFAFQWSNKKLLYPITRTPERYQRPEDWQELIVDVELSNMLRNWFSKKTKPSEVVKYRRSAINSVVSSTCWYDSDQINDEELSLVQKAISDGGVTDGDKKQRRTHDFQILVMNEIRYMLIDSGRDDIRSPRNISKEKRGSHTDDNGNYIQKFEWIDTEQHPNLSPIKQKAEEYITRLRLEGLAVGTLATYGSLINKFVRYLMLHYPFEEITIDTVNNIYDPKNKDNLLDFYSNNGKSREVAIVEVKKCGDFLVHCELFSEKSRKNMPRARSRIRTQPYREAMPKEMVADIVDIIKHRPPNSTTKWDKERVDSSWWKFDVYPVYPMMMLFNYFIPVRGEQVRNLCRDKSFVFNNGLIETIVINTDKNVNRKYLQELPCVWDDLQKFVPFLKWHKGYFNHLQKVRYHDDNNSPWEDIRPLFITPNVLKPMNRGTHAVYHKKLLCVYQLEKMEEAKKRGDNNYPVVAWRKDEKPFFETAEEVGRASAKDMDEIDVMYDLHSLRVTGATRYLESGVGVSMVMELTGHKSIETFMRVYIRLTKEEKIKKLKSAIDKIYFGKKEDLVENSSNLIRGELTRAYSEGKDSLEKSFDDNALFSLHRKATVQTESIGLKKGTEIAVKKHPSSWVGMIHGICPRVNCPEGRENKCSLCPYLITGKLFMDGVVHQINRAFAEFQRCSCEINEHKKKNYTSQGQIAELESLLEEILGWQEILDKISIDIVKEESNDLSDDDDEKQLALIKEKAKSVFGTEVLTEELVYLKNAYDAQLIGVEQDRYALKVLTIKAMKLAVASGNENQFDLLSGDETKSIDMLMKYYVNAVEHKEDVNTFISSIKMLPVIHKK